MSSRRQRSATGYDLPVDVQIEIFSKMPAKNVVKFRCLSKFHRNLIDRDLEFARKHYDLSIKTDSSFLIRQVDGRNILVDFKGNERKDYILKRPRFFTPDFIGCSRGIICYGVNSTPSSSHLLFWNPLTGASRRSHAKHGRNNNAKLALGYDAVNDDLKLLWTVQYRNEDMCFVYSSKSDSWTRIQGPGFIRCGNWGAEVTVKGSSRVHATWKDSNSILAFDFAAEKFNLVPLPSFRHHIVSVWCVDACLCFYEEVVDEGCYNVWMMKEYGVEESWARVFTVSNKNRPSRTMKDFVSGLVPLHFLGPDQLLMLSVPPASHHLAANTICLYDQTQHRKVFTLNTLVPTAVTSSYLYAPTFRLP